MNFIQALFHQIGVVMTASAIAIAGFFTPIHKSEPVAIQPTTTKQISGTIDLKGNFDSTLTGSSNQYSSEQPVQDQALLKKQELIKAKAAEALAEQQKEAQAAANALAAQKAQADAQTAADEKAKQDEAAAQQAQIAAQQEAARQAEFLASKELQKQIDLQRQAQEAQRIAAQQEADRQAQIAQQQEQKRQDEERQQAAMQSRQNQYNTLINEYNAKLGVFEQQINDITTQYYSDKAAIESSPIPLEFIQGRTQKLYADDMQKINQIKIQEEQLRLDYNNKISQL